MAVTVSVSSDSSNPTHHVSLDDGSTTVGLNIKGFPKGFRQYPYSPSSMKFNQGRSGYSSFEMPYTSIDQTDWSGGLGQLKFEDPTRFFDAYNMWTVTPGVLTTCPIYTWGTGHRDSDGIFLTFIDDTAYKKLSGARRYRYSQFTADSSYDAAIIMVYMRYFGSPGSATIAIYSDDASDKPSTLLKSKTVAANTSVIQEGSGVAQWIEVELASVQGITDGTKYHVVVSDAANADDTTTDYWELPSRSDSGYATGSSDDGSTWTADGTETTFLFRVTDADTSVKYHFFEHKRAHYVATEPDDGSAGKILINGDRGVVTGTSTSSTLQDTTKSWTTNEWNGSYVYIWKGTGRGQIPRQVTTNTSDTLTLVPTWDITPIAGVKDTGSEYVILGSTKWTDVTPSGSGAETITKPIKSVITLWEIIYLAQGDSVNMLRVREYNDEGVYKTFWGANAASGSYGTNVSKLEGGTNWADFLTTAYDPVHENIIWRAQNKDANLNTSVSRADDVTWNDGGDGTGTDLSFPTTGLGAPVAIGNPDYKITNIEMYNNLLYIGKEDNLWYLENDGKYDRAYPVPVGLAAMASSHNCIAMVSKDLFLFINWSHSVERLFGSTMDDIGPWRDFGMPEYAKGYISALEPVVGWMFGAIDGGSSKTSSVLIYQNGWHPLFRVWTLGRRIRSLKWQTIDEKANFLWFGCGGDLMRMRMPHNTLNPTQDDDMYFSPEGTLTTSIYDAGYAELEKYFDSFKIVTSEIDSMGVDYSTDIRLESGKPTTWTDAGFMTSFPSDTVSVAQSRKRNIMLRIRLQTSNAYTPGYGVIYATVLDAVARTPDKFNWDMRVALDEDALTLTGALDHDPDTLIDQIVTWGGQAQALTYRCVDEFADDSGSGRKVFIEPPNIFRTSWNKITLKLFGYATVTLREL